MGHGRHGHARPSGNRHDRGRGGAACTRKAKPSHLKIGRRRSERKYAAWLRRADKAAATGNVVSSAIYRARAEYWAPAGGTPRSARRSATTFGRFVVRLQAALDIDGPDMPAWRESLLALVHQTPRGIWTVEARLLYDLQKVCVDHERGVSTVDVVEWVLSLGKRPIKRPLPSQREVLMSKHLRSAAGG